eukprot:gene6238-1113_t
MAKEACVVVLDVGTSMCQKAGTGLAQEGPQASHHSPDNTMLPLSCPSVRPLPRWPLPGPTTLAGSSSHLTSSVCQPACPAESQPPALGPARLAKEALAKYVQRKVELHPKDESVWLRPAPTGLAWGIGIHGPRLLHGGIEYYGTGGLGSWEKSPDEQFSVPPVGIILVGTSTTDNALASQFEGQYSNIWTYYPLMSPTVDMLQQIDRIPGEGQDGDWLDAVVVAVDMLHNRPGKVKRKVTLISDACHDVSPHGEMLPAILDSMKNEGIELMVFGIGAHAIYPLHYIPQPFATPLWMVCSDFEPRPEPDQAELSDNETMKRQNEKVLYLICDELNTDPDGEEKCQPVKDAIELISELSKKVPKATTTFRGCLEIGSLSIGPLWCYLRTKKTGLPVAKKRLARALCQDGDTGQIQLQRRYFNPDDQDAEIPPERIIKAYKYGKSVVPFAAADEAGLKLATEKSLTLLSFASRSCIKRHWHIGSCRYFLPVEGNENAARAVAALVEAMNITNRVAIVRFVPRKNASPELGALLAEYKDKRPLLFYTKLPFAEDLREDWAFSTLDSIAISDEMLQEETSAVKLSRTFNPCYHHFISCVRARAADPYAPLPALDPAIVKGTGVGQGADLYSMFEQAIPAYEKCRDVFGLEEVVADTKDSTMRHWYHYDGQPVDLTSYTDAVQVGEDDGAAPPAKAARIGESDDLAAAIFTASQSSATKSFAYSSLVSIKGDDKPGDDSGPAPSVREVGTINPVKDFWSMCDWKYPPSIPLPSQCHLADHTWLEDLVDKAVDGMVQVVDELIKDSIRDRNYPKALQCLQALREGCLREEESARFNKELERLKTQHQQGRRKEFWSDHVVKAEVTLISEKEGHGDSEVTPEVAAQFLTETSSAAPSLSLAAGPDSAAEDPFDMIE